MCYEEQHVASLLDAATSGPREQQSRAVLHANHGSLAGDEKGAPWEASWSLAGELGLRGSRAEQSSDAQRHVQRAALLLRARPVASNGGPTALGGVWEVFRCEALTICTLAPRAGPEGGDPPYRQVRR